MKRQSLNPKKKIIIGLTGSFGSGKTTVAGIFKEYGAKIIDADRIAHRIIRPKTKIYKKIVKAFGKDILKKDTAIDRSKLAKIVFDSPDLLKRLNNIVHPEVIRIIRGNVKAAQDKVIVLDVPLLIESALKNLVDKIIVVRIPKQKQIERIRKILLLSKTDILKRIDAQMSLSDKVRLADFVIDNSGAIEKTKKQVGKIRRLLWKN